MTRRPLQRFQEADVYREIAVFTGNSHRSLAEAVCRHLEIPVGNVQVIQFSNEEVFVKYEENIRERDVLIIQPIVSPVKTRLREMLIMIDAATSSTDGTINPSRPYTPKSNKRRVRQSGVKTRKRQNQ